MTDETTHPAIEKVARALNDDYELITPYDELPLSKRELLRYQAWTAIRSTLEYYRENVSRGMVYEANGAMDLGPENMVKAALLKALSELDAKGRPA